MTNTDNLIKAIMDYENGTDTMPGPARQARHLLRVAENHRNEVGLLSNYILNTTPGYRPSDATARAVDLYLAHGIEYVRQYHRDPATGLRTA